MSQITIDNITYSYYGSFAEVNDNTLSVPNSDVVIPSIINVSGTDYTVITIRDQAFASCSFLRSITLPNTIISIYDLAFEQTQITSIILPNSIENIAAGAFIRCGLLTTVTLPSNPNFVALFPSVFRECPSLTSITIPNTVTTIGSYAFNSSGLTSITIPDSVTTIGEYAFTSCTSLSSVTLPNNINFITLNNNLFASCSSLTSITIPNTIIEIQDSVFMSSGLTSITIPNSVESIGAQSFRFCNQLLSAVLPNNPNFTTLNVQLFGSCPSLTSMSIPNSVTTIGPTVFYYCNGITSVTIPNSVTTIQTSAFENCIGLTSVLMPDSVTTVGNSIFKTCAGLTSIKLSNNLSLVPNQCFIGCNKLKKITIPNSVLSIQTEAFRQCTLLSEVVLPSSLISIGNQAFRTCTHMSLVTIFGNTSISLGTDVFLGTSAFTLRCKDGAATTRIPNNISNATYVDFINMTGITTTTDGNDVSLELTGSIPPSSNKVEREQSITQYILTNVSDISSKNIIIDRDIFNYLEGADVPFNLGSENIRIIVQPLYTSPLPTINYSNSTLYIILNDGESVTIQADGVTKSIKKIDNISYADATTDVVYESGFRFGNKITKFQPISIVVYKPGVAETDLRGKYYIFDGFEASVSGFVDPAELGNTNIVIASDMNFDGIEYDLNAISDDAFTGNTFLESVVIPSNIVKIGKNVFKDCTNLTSVTIPNSVTLIDTNAFESCISLTSIQLPNAITSISTELFYKCTLLASITIPASVTSIGNSAFRDCAAITTITIPDTITAIGTSTFRGCTSLQTATLPTNINFIAIPAHMFQDCTSLASITIPNSITAINDEAFLSCEGLETITLPNILSTIGAGALEGCILLEKLDIPVTLTSIGSRAFFGCESLTSLLIPYGVTQLGASAFKACSNLATVLISKSVSSIGDQAFADCTNLVVVTFFGISPITFGTDMFLAAPSQFILRSAGKTVLNIPNDVDAAYNNFIDMTGITTTTNGNNVTLALTESISPSSDKAEREESFIQYVLTNVTNISTKNITIDKNIFQYLEGSNAPSDIKFETIKTFFQHKCVYLNPSPTFNCSDGVSHVVFGDGLEITLTVQSDSKTIKKIDNTTYTVDNVSQNVGDVLNIGSKRLKLGSATVYNQNPINIDNIMYAYDGTTASVVGNTLTGTNLEIEILSSINIEGINYTVTTIDQDAFAECVSIRSISLPNTITQINLNAFVGCTSLFSIIIPNSVESIGENVFQNCTQLSSITLPTNTNFNVLQTNVFRSCTSLTSIMIPNSVTIIGAFVFSTCTSLIDITLSNTLTTINDTAFSSCSNLAAIVIPNTVESIGESAFTECTNLSSITLPNNINFQTMEANLFRSCTSLTSITIPSSVTSLGNSVFNGSGLTSIVIPNTVTSMGETLFMDCESLVSIRFPDNLNFTQIGAGTFYNCVSLTSVFVPQSILSIGENTFRNCESLNSVALPNGLQTIDENLFRDCTSLTTLTIPSSVTLIRNNAFTDCTNLSHITFMGNVSITFESGVFDGTQPLVIRCEGGNTTTNIPEISGATYVDFVNLIDMNITTNGDNVSLVLPESIPTSPDKTARESSFVQYITLNVPDALSKNIYVNMNTLQFLEESNTPSNITSDSIRVIIQYPGLYATLPPTYNLSDGSTYIILGNGMSITISVFGVTKIINKISETVHTVEGVQYNIGDILAIGQKQIKFGSVIVYSPNPINIDDIIYTYSTSSLITTITGNTLSGSDLDITLQSSINIDGIDYTVTAIGPNAFSGSSLTSITIPNTVTSIESFAFSGSSLTSITIPNTVTSIGSHIFENCANLVKATLPNEILEIPAYCFANCSSLISIIIPTSVTTIRENSFYLCTSIVLLAIPSSVTVIGNNTFEQCTSLEEITFFGRTPITPFGDNVFLDVYSFNIICADGALTEYIPNNIPNATYYDFANLENIRIVTKGNDVELSVGVNPVESQLEKRARESSLIQFILVNITDPMSKNFYINSSVVGFVEGITTPELVNTKIRMILRHHVLNIETPDLYNMTIGNYYVIIGTDTTIEIQIDSQQHTITRLNETLYKINDDSYSSDDVVELGSKIIKFGSIIAYNSVVEAEICFGGDVYVGTDQGIIKIKDICPKKNTIGRKKIVAIVKVKCVSDYIYCIKQNAFGKNPLGKDVPDRDTIVTGDHGIYINKKCDKHCDKMTIVKNFKNIYVNKIKNSKNDNMILYNVLMETHGKMMVNNMLVETMDPDNEIAKLYFQ